MVEKILFWLDAGFTQFGIAKSLQKIIDGKYFAIIDTNKGRQFFKNQKFVNFEKIWFYRDCFDENKKIYIRTKFKGPIDNYVRISLGSPKKLSGFVKEYINWKKK